MQGGQLCLRARGLRLLGLQLDLQGLLGGGDPLKGLLHLNQWWPLPLGILGGHRLPELPRDLWSLPGQSLSLLHFLVLH